MKSLFATRRHLAVSTLCVAAAAAFLVTMHPAARSSESPVTSDVCLDCHDTETHGMMGTAHDPAGGKVSCLGCHAGAATERHVDDPENNPAVNPGKLSADSLTAVCTTCHAQPHALNIYERDPHGAAGLACTACHQIHDNRTHASLLKNDQPGLCLSCHPGVRAQFAETSHHPVMEKVVACSDCHVDVFQSTKQHTANGPGEVCVTCHAQFQGPFPFEHPAAVGYSTEEGGCLNCHAAHGSQFPRLLKQSYESPHFALCSQCHSVPKHLNNMKHGTQWAGVPCNECHSDIHGSYTHRNLLDPSLESQGCLKAGCHK
jgi:DmsE family decaheme c-type cytochrome